MSGFRLVASEVEETAGYAKGNRIWAVRKYPASTVKTRDSDRRKVVPTNF